MGILEEIGSYEYHCPSCEENLKAKDGIEFLTKGKLGKMRSIYLDPNLGKYDFYYDYSLDFEEGEKVDFFCKHCEASLQSKKHSDFVEIIMVVSEAVKFEVLFSRIYGVKRTYIVTEDYVEQHGEDKVDFDELFEI